MQRSAVILLLSASLPGFGSPGCRPAAKSGSSEASAAPRPNIVLVMIDTLRADRVGAYGHPGRLTPTLDAIAREGVLFERAIAPAPWTQPSIASLFSGVYPGVHGVTDYVQAKGEAPRIRVLRESFESLAERAATAGYQTAAFVANPFVVPEFGFAQGFEHFDASLAGNLTRGLDLNQAVGTWLERRRDSRPLFLYVHYMDVHGPYNAGPEFVDPLLDAVGAKRSLRVLTEEETKRLDYLYNLPSEVGDIERHRRLSRYWEYWVARYEAGVAQQDHALADLRARLERLDLWEDTYLILTADHGEALCEHGVWDHGLTAHHPELHVPLILRWLSVLPSGERVPQVVRLLDILPTLVGQLRLPPPAGVQGRSLLRWVGSGRGVEEPAFAEAVKGDPECMAVYAGDWKLTLWPRNQRAGLYDLRGDPLEQRNRVLEEPERLKAMAALILRQREDNRRRASMEAGDTVPLTPEQLDRLRSHGYLR